LNYLFKTRSLKWRLVSQFAILLGLLMLVINIGFVIWIISMAPNVNGADEAVQAVIMKSIVPGENGPRVEPTTELDNISKAFPTFWFVAASPNGATVGYGHVPGELQPLIPRIKDLESFAVLQDEGSPLTAGFAKLETSAGPVKIVYGGKSTPGSFLGNLLWGLKVLYLPTTLIPLLLVFLAMPFIVNRAFSGIRRTTREASLIDVNFPGRRLRREDVVEELDPLVNAINTALARIDADIGTRQRFLAAAAHELRTPIAILQTRIETLGEGEHKSKLLKDIGRLAAVAEQLLDMQRFAFVQSWSDVDLVELCETIAADLVPLAIAGGYALELETQVKSIIVHGDRTSMERAVTNLVKNAIEHAGGHGRIVVAIKTDGAIEVSDDGVGIAAQYRQLAGLGEQGLGADGQGLSGAKLAGWNIGHRRPPGVRVEADRRAPGACGRAPGGRASRGERRRRRYRILSRRAGSIDALSC